MTEPKLNPMEALHQADQSMRQNRRTNELEMLEKWKKSQDPQHLQPLLQAYNPVIHQKIKQWKAPSIPESAFKAELQGHLIKALETYDPNRGAQLSTHVENRLRKAMRYNANYQNVARIPEGQIKNITPVKNAQNELQEQFGRPPTHDEIADHIGMPVRHVTRILGALRADIPDSAFESSPEDTMKQIGRDHEVLSLLPHVLNADEHKVFNHVFGLNGHDRLDSTNELAKKLNKSPSQVSRLKSSILKKYDQYK